MTLTNEDLLAFSQMLDVKLDAKLKPIENRLERIEVRVDNIERRMNQLEKRMDQLEKRMDDIEVQIAQIKTDLAVNIKPDIAAMKHKLQRIEVDLLENNIIPRLNTIESCYMDTFNRYKDYADRMEATFADTELLKKVVIEHSESIQRLA